MPKYSCKVISRNGQVMFSKVTENSRIACIKKLRSNDLIPISVTPVISLGRKKNAGKKTRNISRNLELSKELNNRTNIRKKKTQDKKRQSDFWAMLTGDVGGGGRKPTMRDIRVFTQNFYLLKKANFNNIHALSTVIQSTENPRLKVILEDILAGVEARRIYVYNYGILFKYIPIYLYKHD